MRAASRLGCLLVVCALALSVTATETAEKSSVSNIWDALRIQLQDVSTVPGAADRVKTLLEQINNRLRAEQLLADAHYQSVYNFYNSRIANLTETVRGHQVQLENIKRRAQNISYAKEQYQVHLSTLDSRIRVIADKIGVIEDKITAGDSIRKEENIRYQRREAEIKEEIQATNHVIDMLGAPKAVPASFAATLNQAVKGAKAPSFLELESLLEASAPSDAEELKDLASTLFDNLHAFLRKVKVEEANRSYRWSVHKFGFQNRSAALQGKINGLEATRIPTQQKLNETNAELAALPATRYHEKQKMAREQKMLDKMTAALQGITNDYNAQTEERNQQLQTADKTYAEIMKHLGDAPVNPLLLPPAERDTQPIFAGKEHLGLSVPEHVPSPTRV